MSDMLTAVAALENAEQHETTCKEALTDAKQQTASAFDSVVDAAASSDDEELKSAAEGVRYVDAEIDAKKFDETKGQKVLTRKVKEAQKALREAAGGAGDPKVAFVNLTAAEEELAELKGELKDLRRARKDHAKRLRQLAGSLA